ncbi:MAG TPA: TetR/AcrR family transcriptional regulator [Actinopolymorphaceae bacterium]|jgi:AcrR family transcriptional regulator
MGRLTRAEMQERNRAKVLAAAREEFAVAGYRGAKIDSIAARAELTRGAVYSNFPSKRALYLAVLADDAERAAGPASPPTASTVGEALGAFARAWLARLPLSTDDVESPARLATDLIPEIVADDYLRQAFTQLVKLQAMLLSLSLERIAPSGGRKVRLAETAITTLHGASQLAFAAPGFVEPFDVVQTCEQLAGLDLDDAWEPPHLPHVAPARSCSDRWSPPAVTDAVRGDPVDLTRDRVMGILGLHRLSAIEEAVRGSQPGHQVSAVLVTSRADELAPLVRLVLAEFRACLHHAVPPTAWPGVDVILDERGSLAAATGVRAVSDATETAVRIRGGRIVARAEGFGACHAAASVG